MVYVRPRTKQTCKLAFLLILSLVTTFLLPTAAGTVRWVVVQNPVRTVINGMYTIDSGEETDIGLFRTCAITPWESRCSTNSYPDSPLSIVDGCEKNAKDLGHRNRATGGFVILAFFASLPLLVVTFFHFRLSMFVDQKRTITFLMFEVSMTRRRGLVLRLLFSSLTCFFAFIALCIYGDTMGRWVGCGDHYCSGMLQIMERQAQNVDVPGVDLHRDVVVNCGFGFSFALLIACFLMMIAFITITLIDFMMRSPGPPTARPEPIAEGTSDGQATRAGVMEDRTPLKMQSGPNSQPQPSSFIVNTSSGAAAVASPPRLLPEGEDWEWDNDSKLWWSPSQELYFDEASGQFYDPESDSWWNPQTGQWFRLQ